MLYFRRGNKDFRIKPLVCAQIIKLKFLAGNFLFGSWLWKDKIAPWFSNLRCVARGATVFPLRGTTRAGSRARPPLNSGFATPQCYFTLPLLSSLLVCHLAEVLSELIFVRTLLVIDFKSGDLGTIWIFEDGSEEESIGRSDDHRTRLIENDSVPPR